MTNNLLDYIYIINENENNAKQPDKINILLKPHQLKMLNKCLQLEQSKIINNENNNIIQTSIGIIGDKVGSGKSYIILGIICNNYNINDNNFQIIHNNPLFKIYSDIYSKLIYKNINILVVPHNIFQQWQLYIDNINISVEYIKTQNELTNITFNSELTNITFNSELLLLYIINLQILLIIINIYFLELYLMKLIVLKYPHVKK